MHVQCVKCDQCERMTRLVSSFARGDSKLLKPIGWYLVLAPENGVDDLHFCSNTCLYNWITGQLTNDQ
jgi:hypothetical protein